MPSGNEVTLLVPVYNAEATVARALRSAAEQVDRILVCDDGSDDDTVREVTALRLPHLTLLRNDTNRGIGATRQRLLEACETELATWMDADDEYMPGRVERMAEIIADDADWVFDAAELIDGDSGRSIRPLPIPDFLQQPDGLLWQLARNYIPSLGWPMVRTAAARCIGYDRSLRQAEDYDHLLRAILAAGDIRFCSTPGYRHYHYPASVSRNIDQQSECAERALRQCKSDDVLNRLQNSRLSDIDRARIAAFYLARLWDWQQLQRLSEAGMADHWELAFFHGVSCFYGNSVERAASAFRQSLARRETACAHNNLGVCLATLGQPGARECFTRALELQPHYRDAMLNSSGNEWVLTRFPLREQPIREMYA